MYRKSKKRRKIIGSQKKTEQEKIGWLSDGEHDVNTWFSLLLFTQREKKRESHQKKWWTNKSILSICLECLILSLESNTFEQALLKKQEFNFLFSQKKSKLLRHVCRNARNNNKTAIFVVCHDGSSKNNVALNLVFCHTHKSYQHQIERNFLFCFSVSLWLCDFLFWIWHLLTHISILNWTWFTLPLEEFNIYLNYVRKLGFEETPDYDFLRELFAKVLKNMGEADDGYYDWNALNGGRGWESQVVSLVVWKTS